MVCIFCVVGSAAIQPAMGQETGADPTITLTVQNEPLGEVLDEIARETGYRFVLNPKWQDHPVSAAIAGLPMEQGLKRLLRSLNHTIVWESDRLITIQVFGKAEPIRSGPAVSFSAPPQPELNEAEPPVEPDRPSEEDGQPTDEGAETTESDLPDGNRSTPEPVADDSNPEQVDPQAPSKEPSESPPSAADETPDALQVTE